MSDRPPVPSLHGKFLIASLDWLVPKMPENKGNKPRQALFRMKRIFFSALSWAFICQLGIADEDAHWRVRFYEQPNAGGLWTKFDVSSNGTSAVPIDEFEKYHLQDKIKEIRYTLPPGVFLICYAGRVFKSVDGDLNNWMHSHVPLPARKAVLDLLPPAIKDAAEKAGIVLLAKDDLVLEGNGSEEIADLKALGWENKIRSAKLYKP